MLTLALLAGVAVGIEHLPGSGGIPAEIRWLLAQNYVPAQHFNRASMLLRLAGKSWSESRGELLRALLRDEDLRLVRGALVLFADALNNRYRDNEFALGDTFREIFREWFDHAPLEEKLALLRPALACCCRDLWPSSGPSPVPLECLLLPRLAQVRMQDGTRVCPCPGLLMGIPLTLDNQRWLVAATLQRGLEERSVAELAVFRAPVKGNGICNRLRRLDRLPIWELPDEHVCEGATEPLDIKSMQNQIWLDHERLLDMLLDPFAEVRQGAGRIVAACGDERGLPAFCAWLRNNPRFTPLAEKMMSDLFGPDWRKRCESGSPTSQPGAGDGGG